MATLLQIRDQLIIDANVLGDPMFPKARLNKIINEAQYFVQRELADLGFKAWEESIAPTMSAAAYGSYTNNVWSTALSNITNYLETKHPILYITMVVTGVGSEAFGIAREVEQKKFLEALQNSYLAPTWVITSNKNEGIFTIADKTLYVAPYSQAQTTEMTTTVYYREKVAELSSDTGASEIPSEFISMVVQKCVVDIKEIKKELNDKQVALAELRDNIGSTFEKYKVASIESENEVLQ